MTVSTLGNWKKQVKFKIRRQEIIIIRAGITETENRIESRNRPMCRHLICDRGTQHTMELN